MTTITLSIDELRLIISEAVTAGILAASKGETAHPPVQPGSFTDRKRAALETRERKLSKLNPPRRNLKQGEK